MYVCMYTYICVVIYVHIHSCFHAFGAGLLSALLSALDAGRPFSVLSFPVELTRHSLLEDKEKTREKDENRHKVTTQVVITN